MKKLSRILCFFLAAPMLISMLCACGAAGSKRDPSKLYIVCTLFPQYDFCRRIAGEKAEVEMLIPPGAETHSFGLKDLSVQKLDELYDADFFICAGGETDGQLTEELKKTLTDQTEFLALTDLAGELLSEEHEAGQAPHEHIGNFDDHVWTSPKRAALIVDGLTEKLCAADPSNESFYRANTETYISELNALDQLFETVISNAQLDTLIFADRFPFRYLCHDYGLTAYAAFEGCSTAVEPSLATLDRLCKTAKELNLPAILYTEGSDPSYAENLAKEIHGKALLLHACHGVSEKELLEKDYIGLQKQNAEVLKAALGENQ